MNKHPFSPTGLQELLLSLYQLADSQLQLEAAAIIANFRAWLVQHFDFLPSQLIYLHGIDNRFIAACALPTSQFVSARQAIIMDKQANPQKTIIAEEGEGKFIRIKKESNARYSQTEAYLEEETLIFTIGYQA